jgi:hypothetical protein
MLVHRLLVERVHRGDVPAAAAPGAEHPGPFARERAGHGPADRPTRAVHHGNLVLQ